MAKIFYDHLIKIDEITIELDKYELTIEEREEFVSIIDETFHHRVLAVILTYLPAEHHQNFLSMFHASPHRPELLDFLKKLSSADIEDKIKEEVIKIKKELLADIRKSKIKQYAR